MYTIVIKYYGLYIISFWSWIQYMFGICGY